MKFQGRASTVRPVRSHSCLSVCPSHVKSHAHPRAHRAETYVSICIALPHIIARQPDSPLHAEYSLLSVCEPSLLSDCEPGARRLTAYALAQPGKQHLRQRSAALIERHSIVTI